MKPPRLALVAPVLACALFSQAQAAALEASASASITNISFTLIDLDPTDGIAPGMVFNATHGLGLGEPDCCYAFGLFSRSWASAKDAAWQEKVGLNQQLELYGYPEQFMSNNELSKSARGITVNTSTTKDSLRISTSVSLDISEQGHDQSHWGLVELGDPGYLNNAFVLTPNTGLVINGDYDLSIHRSSNIGQARARVAFSVFGDDAAGTQGFAENIDTFWTHQNDARSGSFTFNITNSSSFSREYGLYADMVVDASLAVPEPGSAWMGIAGVSILALIAAARSRQQKLG